MLEKCQKIHEATIRILEKTGMKFFHPDAIKVLKEHGVRMEGDIAYFKEEQIMKWVKKAPSSFKVYGRDEQYTIDIGGDNHYLAPTAGPTNIVDMEGNRRTVTVADFIELIKYLEVNEDYYINGGVPIQPTDLPSEISSLAVHYMSLLHSKKTIWTTTGNYQQVEDLMELTKVAYNVSDDEEFARNPRVFGIINTDSPLRLDVNMTESLFTYAKYRQPIVIAGACMAGTTGPVTLAGTITMTNAEVLATTVLVQMFAPGTPVIYGSQSSNADLRNGSMAIGSPEGALCYKYGAQMASFYGLPSRGGGALCDAKGIDIQAGSESMLTYLGTRQGGTNIILHSAGILNSYLDFSFEKMVVDFDIVQAAERYMSDIEINADTIPEDVIDEVGHQADYILDEHTLEFCRSEAVIPYTSVRGAAEDPQNALKRNIEKRLKTMISQYQQPKLGQEIVVQMDQIMLRAGTSPELLQILKG